MLTLGILSSQNPINGNQGFQIITEGNFTEEGGHHIHGPLAIGGNLIINNAATGEINMDNTGSYIFPGDEKHLYWLDGCRQCYLDSG